MSDLPKEVKEILANNDSFKNNSLKLNTLINKKLNDNELEKYLTNNFMIPDINKNQLTKKVNLNKINYNEINKLLNKHNNLLIDFQNIIKQINNKLKEINNKEIFIALIKQINYELKNNNQFVLFDTQEKYFNNFLGFKIVNHEKLNDVKEYHQLFKLRKELDDKLYYLLKENNNYINKILIKKIEYFITYFKSINIQNLKYEAHTCQYNNNFNNYNIILFNKQYNRYIEININTKEHYYDIIFTTSNIDDLKEISTYLSNQNIQNKINGPNDLFATMATILDYNNYNNNSKLTIYRNEE